MPILKSAIGRVKLSGRRFSCVSCEQKRYMEVCMMIIVMMVSYCVPAAWARETVHSPFAQKIKNCAKVTFFKNLSNDKLLKTINGGHESARSWMQAGSLHVFFSWDAVSVSQGLLPEITVSKSASWICRMGQRGGHKSE